MWSLAYSTRLISWSSLRETVSEMPADEALTLINDWWFDSPWHPYGLHWDDQDQWPDPWALLEDSALCPIARALGIVYTISMLDREDLESAVMVLTDQGDTLVVHGDMILNWDREVTLNKNLSTITRTITVQEVRSLYS